MRDRKKEHAAKRKPQNFNHAILKDKILNLRASGKSYTEISNEVGITSAYVYRLAGEALKEIAIHTRETAEQIRVMDDICLQKAKLALMRKIESESSNRDLPRLAMALARVIETRARMNGTLAPVKLEGEVDVNVSATANIKIDYTALTADELGILERILEQSAVRAIESAGREGATDSKGVHPAGMAGTEPVN